MVSICTAPVSFSGSSEKSQDPQTVHRPSLSLIGTLKHPAQEQRPTAMNTYSLTTAFPMQPPHSPPQPPVSFPRLRGRDHLLLFSCCVCTMCNMGRNCHTAHQQNASPAPRLPGSPARRLPGSPAFPSFLNHTFFHSSAGTRV